MTLTPNEIRDITALLEAGKPLPDKYRFVLFGDQRQVGLVWDGKTNAVCDAILPFQIIEQVDEPRSEQTMKMQPSLFDFSTGRQLKGWSNKLIWGDNKFVLSSLRSGPLRDEIEANGGITLVYIDPPFDVGADFTVDVEIGDDSFAKEPNVLEEVAYRDTWGRGQDSFFTMIYERLTLIHQLLREDGSIFVHCDWRASPQLRMILDEIFGAEQFQNEIYWYYYNKLHGARKMVLPRATDTILYYVKNRDARYTFRHLSEERDKPIKKLKYHFIGGKIVNDKDASGKTITYLSTERQIDNVWRIRCLQPANKQEWLSFPTQTPQDFIERILEMASNEGDIVADFFSGSGTTAAAAEGLNRKWIVSDLGEFSIHTARKRLIASQRQLKSEGKNWRAFEILNLGRYERGLLLASHTGLESDAALEAVQRIKDDQFERLILSAYSAEHLESSSVFVGTKLNRHVVVGPVNLPVTRLFVEHVITEARRQKLTKVDVLAFEFEMGLFPNIQSEARELGVDLALKYIPRDVFDKRAVQAGQVRFHDVAYIDAKLSLKRTNLSIELTEYSVGYQQDSLEGTERTLMRGAAHVVVENGHVVKLTKDADGIISRMLLTKHWSESVDYWAIDFDFQNRKELVNVKNPVTGEFEAKWTGDFVFENEWQSFRTKKNRTLDLVSPPRDMFAGDRQVAIKVVDIFGNNTMKVIPVRVGK